MLCLMYVLRKGLSNKLIAYCNKNDLCKLSRPVEVTEIQDFIVELT